VVDAYRDFSPNTLAHQLSNVIQNLERHGFNTAGRIHESQSTLGIQHHSFLVIISVSSISRGRTALRVFSKAWAVGCFAAGTATFASANPIIITVAMTVIALILGAGVFGPVAYVRMVSEMMKDNPVIHRVVQSEIKAE